jgi:GNAT superfamily N-acetyltransferase
MEIRAWTPERRAEVFDLLRACLGERETARRDERFWNWKHETSPFGGSMILLGEEDGQYVGLRAFMRWQWATGDGPVAAVRAVDTVTHPAHQRKGIFTRLTRAGLDAARADGARFVFNTPNANSMPGYLKMGWRHVAHLPMQVRILRPLRFGLGILRSKVLSRASSANGRENPTAFRKAPQSVMEFLDKEHGLASLLSTDASLRGKGLTTARSADFLRWRYGAHPYVTYYVESVRNGNRLEGALIWRFNSRFGLQEVMICDLLLARPDAVIAAELVSSLRDKVSADYLISHFGEGSVHRATLGRCGFFNLPGQGMNFTVRDLGAPVEPDPFQYANWSLCLGDLEIF